MEYRKSVDDIWVSHARVVVHSRQLPAGGCNHQRIEVVPVTRAMVALHPEQCCMPTANSITQADNVQCQQTVCHWAAQVESQHCKGLPWCALKRMLSGATAKLPVPS